MVRLSIRVIFCLVASISSISGFAKEGFVHPTLELGDKLLGVLQSTVAFNAGSGVVISKDRILTAYHVIGGCGCPVNRVAKSCVRPIRVPRTVDHQGEVLTWLYGQTKAVIACGDNADRNKSYLIEQMLRTTGVHLERFEPGAGTYWPRQDLALLEVTWDREIPPAIPVRRNSLSPDEQIFALGYPGRTVRSFFKKDIRFEASLKTVSQLTSLQTLLKAERDLSTAVLNVKAKNQEDIEEWVRQSSAFPVDSPEANTILFGAIDLLSPIGMIIGTFESKGLVKACEFWNEATPECERKLIASFIETARSDASAITQAIRSQSAELSYPEADQSLRISHGKFLFYQDNPEPGFPGALFTDVDAVSGNSGGPLVDSNGQLTGIVTLGPSGTSLSYQEGMGLGAVSHFGISRLLESYD